MATLSSLAARWGGWSDTGFVRRGFGVVGVLLVFSVTVGGCGSSHRVGVGSSRRSLNIVAGGAQPALPFVLGDVFRLAGGGRPYRLAGYGAGEPRVFRPGVGEGCDSVVRSPDSRYLIYGTSQNGWPALAVLDLRTGAHFMFRTHACEPSWGHGGEIAYIHYLIKPSTDAYSAQALVQHGLSGAPRAWTGSGSWKQPIWAGEDLLLSSGLGVVVLYGPHRQRGVDGYPSGPLGPFSRVVAVNPQGTEALFDTQRLGPGGGGDGATDLATLLSVSDDRVLSQVVTGKGVAALAAEGSWQGDEIITTDGYFQGGSSHPPAALVTLTVTGDRVRVRSIRGFVEHGEAILGQELAGAFQARFLDADRRRVAVWFHRIGVLRYVACDTLTADCTGSRNYEDPGANEEANATFVADPARP